MPTHVMKYRRVVVHVQVDDGTEEDRAVKKENELETRHVKVTVTVNQP